VLVDPYPDLAIPKRKTPNTDIIRKINMIHTAV
jgi:hypothetical protein